METTGAESVQLLTTAPAMAHETILRLDSRHTGRSYRIQIFTPTVEPPPGGYPVLYLTDGAMNFRQAADQMLGRALTDLRPAFVVGITYLSDALLDAVRLRTWDLTPSRPTGSFRAMFADWGRFGGYGEDDTGGAERFYRFLVEELRPWLAGRVAINSTDQAFFGHSLGGLFGLYVLFNHGDAFQTYAISSPSLVWNDGEVTHALPAFAEEVEAGRLRPRILLMRGGVEKIDHFGSLALRLQSIRGGDGYVAQKVVFFGEHHMSVPPAAVSRAMSFAFSRIDPIPEFED